MIKQSRLLKFSKSLFASVFTATVFMSSPQTHAEVAPAFSVHDAWNAVWEREFVPGQSAILMNGGAGIGTWNVQLLEGPNVVNTGTYVEVFRVQIEELSPTQDALIQSGLLSYDHYITAGLLSANDGFQYPVAGIANTIQSFGASSPVHVLTPLSVESSIDDALGIADYAQQLYELQAIALIDDQGCTLDPVTHECTDWICPPTITDPCCCRGRLSYALVGCSLSSAICQANAADAAITCFNGCTGPDAPVCIALCSVDHVLASAACLASHASCISSAQSNYVACENSCP